MLRTGFHAKLSKPRCAASRTARRKNLVLAMMAGPAAHRVRETVTGLPRRVIADAKEQVFEFKRPS
ncbi:hypothetical protein B7G54_22075 [Burkholderia puraquae]|uniref:Uncharacterized protein n=1 Tax=Burkholderia puraquae TaxID=1904757 RepID=A0A1X1PCV4_9BURK|nr:hypothetical protein [Burkholderia puraquae]ORT83578.1 hypothetical protein B7G54_22075 [Burkholderia puraquae]CAB3761245.1 hypothetical protein LMG29660_04224 [Burkholderia puraquae]